MNTRALLLLVLALLPGASCASGGRMLRMTPFAGDALPDAERVNLWPLLYRNGDATALLWPVFDHDGRGFAVRPLVGREGTEWTVLYPLTGWDSGDGSWWVVPAYRSPRSFGVFPLFHVGRTLSTALLVWWVRPVEPGEPGDAVEAWGVFPFFGTGTEPHVGPVWWEEDGEAWGVFPLAALDEDRGFVGPVYWIEADELDLHGAFPLYHYQREGDYAVVLTPLGGRGWSAGGERSMLNVLGPLLHVSSDGEGRSTTALAWPLFRLDRDGESVDARLWPVGGYAADGEARTWSAVLGAFERTRTPGGSSLRLAPLFSVRDGVRGDPWDWLTLVAWVRGTPDEEGEARRAFHLGTPLLFHHAREGRERDWGGLLDLVTYEASGDEASLRVLWHLYRSERRGDQVHRDLFPGLTWDSGPERSGVSFLWRVFRYGREGDRRGGHVLFLPWGDA